MSAWRALATALGLAAAAQTGARDVSGRVVRAVGPATVPVAGVWVVLHRVGPDTARPLDSMRTRADGSYRFAYRATGSTDAIYFVAARWDGIAYFSAPLATARVSGADAELTVFDTTSTGAALRERGHHVIIFKPRADGSREVVEVHELTNDGTRTLVSAGGGRPTWSTSLPSAAQAFRAGQSDIAAETIIPLRDRVDVFAPFAPGVKQLTFTYQLPPSAFPLALTLARDSVVFEVLLEEPGASATGAGLRAVDSVTLDAHRLARWLAPNAPGGGAVRITTPVARLPRTTYAIILLAVLMSGAMAAAAARAARTGA